MARKQNPINDIVDTVGAWFGGSRGAATNPQVRRVQRDLGTVAKTIDTYGTGGVGQAALRDIENFKQGGSLPTNVMKTAAVNLAVGAVGAKAAQVAGRAAVATGIPARAANKLTGRAVMVHGTGERLVGKQLRPRAGSPGSPSDAMVFGWNPMSKNSSQWLPENAANYSNRVGGGGPPDYNVVIGKVKKSKTDLGKPGSNPNIIRSSAPVDIKQVVKSPGATGVSYETYAKELDRALKRAGAPTRGKLSNKIKDAKRRAAYRRSDKGGVS